MVTGCFVTSMMCMQFGDTHELLNQKRKNNNDSSKESKVNWTSYKYGAYMGMLPWLIMWYEVARILIKYDVPLNLIPWWVWAFLAEYWLLFWCFPINMLLQYLQWGPFDDKKYPLLKNGGYIAGERGYILLSFISKSIILWQVGIAAFREKSNRSQVGDDFIGCYNL